MNHFCRLMQIPKWLRLCLAWILIGIGLPLFLTPIPGGFLIAAAGGMLLFCASPNLRSRIQRALERFPKLARRVAPLFHTCDFCPNECRDQTLATDTPSTTIPGDRPRTDIPCSLPPQSDTAGPLP
jgi:hypothetical protein